jgi:hypothetical protein
VRALAVIAIRLAVVGLGLAGIVAMHGLSVTDAGGMHRSPVAATSHDAHEQVDTPDPAPGCSTGEDCHLAMAGCLAILLGLIGFAALRLQHVSRSAGGPPTSFRRAFAPPAARAPPRPIFLSLCVFRT